MIGLGLLRLSDAALRRAAWVVTVLLVVVDTVVVAVSFTRPAGPDGAWEAGGRLSDIAFTLAVLVFPWTGLLIVRRQPRNAVGWVLLAVGAAWGLADAAVAYASIALVLRPGLLPGADEAAALGAAGWAPAIGIMGTYLLLLFPDGRLPSERWRVLAWLSAAVISTVTVTIVLTPGPIGVKPVPDLANPLGVDSLRTELAIVQGAALPMLPLCILGSAAGLVSRFRRSNGVERLQLKWLATAGAAVACMYLVGVAASLSRSADPGGSEPGWLLVLQSVAVLSFLLLPLSIGTAMLRHRLYDIDVVINRTLVYGSLTALLVATYIGCVLLLQLVLSPLTETSDLAVATSTLAAAALFRPARARIQAVVDRRFFRRRYDAARTLDEFTGRLRHEVDLESVGSDLRATVRESVQPAHVSLWLRGAP